MFSSRIIGLYRALANACKAGVAPGRALRTFAAREGDPALAKMAGEIDSGRSIGEAMLSRPDFFPLWQTEVVAVGEAGGRLDRSFELIADTLESRRAFWLSLLPKMVYPAFLLHFAPVALYAGTAFSAGWGAFFFKVLRALFTLYAVTWVIYRFVLRVRRSPAILFRLPFASGFIRGSFSSFLSLLVSAGLPLSKALGLAARAAGLPAEHPGLKAADALSGTGVSAVEVLAALSIFTPEELDCIRTGEMTGTLDKELKYLAATVRERNQAVVSTILYVAPSIVLVLVGLLMARQIIGFYSARLNFENLGVY